MRCRKAFLFVGLMLAGCGDGGAPDQRADAQSAFDAAIAAEAQKNYVAAEAAWNEVIDIGRLDPDQFVQAHLHRAICRARNGKFDEAVADLEAVKDVVPNMDEYHAARSFVLGKQGNAAQARAEFAKARKLNPNIVPIEN